MAADDLVRPVALDRLRAGVPALHDAVGVQHEDRVVAHALHQQRAPRRTQLFLAAGARQVARDLGVAGELAHRSAQGVMITLAQKREPSLRSRQPSSSKRPRACASRSSSRGQLEATPARRIEQGEVPAEDLRGASP